MPCGGIPQRNVGELANLSTLIGCVLIVCSVQLAALFNELQARGDKTKLMQLFGH
jgi:hypothetical protein